MEDENKNNNIAKLRKIDENNSELLIYGPIRKQWPLEILYGVDIESGRFSALEMADILEKVETPNLTVRINSPGGNVDEGLAIYNLLKNFKGNVTTMVDGFACSAASVIFMAGKKRIVPESSLLMIHNAWSYAEGDHNDLRKAADDLEKITEPSVNIYSSVTGQSKEQIKEWMDNETWITAEEALKYGFATSIESNSEVNQSFEMKSIKKLIMRNKELEKILNDNSNAINELVEKDDTSWSSFFNKK